MGVGGVRMGGEGQGKFQRRVGAINFHCYAPEVTNMRSNYASTANDPSIYSNKTASLRPSVESRSLLLVP